MGALITASAQIPCYKLRFFPIFNFVVFFSPNSPFVGTILFACLFACFGARLELRLCVD